MNIRTLPFRTILLFALLVVTGFCGALYFRTTLVADDDARLQRIPDHSALEAQERAKPRFEGEIGGIFLSLYEGTVPEKFTTYRDLCGPEGSRDIPDQYAGALTLDLYLPEEFVLDTKNENTGTVACGDSAYVSRKSYTYALSNDENAEVIIGRSLLNYDEVDVAYDRPRLDTIAGRKVVIVDNLTKDGYWQRAQAWFPEPFGMTFISTYNLPESEFLKLVEIVASTTRTQ